MKIALCCSMKYRDLLRETIEGFNAIGIIPLFPNLGDDKVGGVDINTIEEKKRLALEHYAAIDEADKVYFITPGGYMGTSLKLELGYSFAKGKQILFSEPTNDVGLDCYVKEFVQTDNLKRFLELSNT